MVQRAGRALPAAAPVLAERGHEPGYLRPLLEPPGLVDEAQRRAHLFHVRHAAGALGEVRLEAGALACVERTLEVIGHQLHELLAAHQDPVYRAGPALQTLS